MSHKEFPAAQTEQLICLCFLCLFVAIYFKPGIPDLQKRNAQSTETLPEDQPTTNRTTSQESPHIAQLKSSVSSVHADSSHHQYRLDHQARASNKFHTTYVPAPGHRR